MSDIGRGPAAGEDIGYRDILHVGPGTLAGRYLRRFWQPVFIGHQINVGHVKPLRILGEDLTLYRGTTGTPHIVGSRCAHRGVKLSLGFVDGDDIRCAYHGWKYDSAGRCVAQPAETRPFCDHVSVKAYPTQEYLGLIFVYMGEGAPPVMPRLGDFEDDEIYIRELATDTWPCSYFDLLENSGDTAHTEFLHWHFGQKTADTLEWQESDWGTSGHYVGVTGKDAVFNHGFHHMPNAAEFATTTRPGFSGVVTRGWRVPRDDDSAIRFNLFRLPRVEAEALAQRKSNTIARDLGDTERKMHPVVEVAKGLLAGVEDMQDLKDRSDGMHHGYLTNIQDCAVLASLGPPSQRDFTESFGRTDVSLALLRRIFIRELKALAEGKPLKEWRRPAFAWPEVNERYQAASRTR